MAKSIVPCRGCRDNYYNQPGNSTSGQCWLLAKAQVVERTRVGVWEQPPYEWLPEEVYNCNQPDGYVYIKKDDPRLRKT